MRKSTESAHHRRIFSVRGLEERHRLLLAIAESVSGFLPRHDSQTLDAAFLPSVHLMPRGLDIGQE